MQNYGKSRDNKILEGLNKFQYMNTPQISQLYFQTIKDPFQRKQKTSERMKKMFDRGYIQRFKFPSEPFIFTIKGNKYNTRIQHYMMMVDCWIYLQANKPSGGIITCEVEIKQDELITDLIIHYKNNFVFKDNYYYLEIENESTGDIIEKIHKYESLIWSLQSDNKPFGQLIIVYKKQSVKNKIESVSFEIPVKTIHISEFIQKWEW
jgi:hypothetical protein